MSFVKSVLFIAVCCFILPLTCYSEDYEKELMELEQQEIELDKKYEQDLENDKIQALEEQKKQLKAQLPGMLKQLEKNHKKFQDDLIERLLASRDDLDEAGKTKLKRMLAREHKKDLAKQKIQLKKKHIRELARITERIMLLKMSDEEKDRYYKKREKKRIAKRKKWEQDFKKWEQEHDKKYGKDEIDIENESNPKKKKSGVNLKNIDSYIRKKTDKIDKKLNKYFKKYGIKK
ncbi:hypothetical protein ACFL35_14015 [Candidatus Riflebacteria bacterium]